MLCLGRIIVPLFLLCAGIALLGTPAAQAQQVDAAAVNVQKPALTVDEIVSRLEERNRERAAALKKFEGKRVYRMEYKGFFGDRHAEMTVSVHYAAPNDREFTVVSQSGSKFIIDHVFKRLMDGEKEAAGGCLDSAPPGIGDVRILEIARERRPLIVFDSLIRFHAAVDENCATEMSMGATVVALPHKPKSEGAHYRGSNDIAGGVDTALAVSRDRDAGLLRLECFKSRFDEEFSLTLRPELSVSVGEFVVTDWLGASTEQSDIEKLAEAIRRNPGQPKERVIEASGMPQRQARALLERFNGQLWQARSGPRHAILYFPVEADRASDPA